MMFGWQIDHPRGLGNRKCQRHGSVAGLTSSTRQTHQPNFKVDFRRAHWRLLLKAGRGVVDEEQGNRRRQPAERRMLWFLVTEIDGQEILKQASRSRNPSSPALSGKRNIHIHQVAQTS